MSPRSPCSTVASRRVLDRAASISPPGMTPSNPSTSRRTRWVPKTDFWTIACRSTWKPSTGNIVTNNWQRWRSIKRGSRVFSRKISVARPLQALTPRAQFLLTSTTRLSADIQYLHTRYATFNYQVPNHGAPPYTGCASSLDADPAFYDVNCAGKPAYNSPLWTVNPGIEQTVPFGNYKFLASVDSQFRTSRYVGFEFQPAQLVGSTWTTNAQLLFAPSDDHWSVAGFRSQYRKRSVSGRRKHLRNCERSRCHHGASPHLWSAGLRKILTWIRSA